MWAVDLIRKKRDGYALTAQDIEQLISAYLQDQVGDEQMAAFCMAVVLNGMNPAETSALVQAMLHSGEIVDLSDIEGIKVDKHSTGGVGDKISICLAPLVAACGVKVPMMSGRGLGHTGGTLDKLAAIPGFQTQLDISCFKALVDTHGLALIGQTPELAPADRRLYALRDTTGTVESIPLIAASIMSKKLAEGIDSLVLDVKVGSGAFMKNLQDARRLADTLHDIGERANKPTTVLLTRMDKVLGKMVGNANETWEAVQILRGEGPEDVLELTLALGGEMLVLGKCASDVSEGRDLIRRSIQTGHGMERLLEVVAAQGGDPSSLETRSGLPTAPHQEEVRFERSGILDTMNVEKVGWAAMRLGAGRARATDVIDHAVGIELLVSLGEKVVAGQPIAVLYHRDGRGVEAARSLLVDAMTVRDESSLDHTMILDRIDGIKYE